MQRSGIQVFGRCCVVSMARTTTFQDLGSCFAPHGLLRTRIEWRLRFDVRRLRRAIIGQLRPLVQTFTRTFERPLLHNQWTYACNHVDRRRSPPWGPGARRQSRSASDSPGRKDQESSSSGLHHLMEESATGDSSIHVHACVAGRRTDNDLRCRATARALAEGTHRAPD